MIPSFRAASRLQVARLREGAAAAAAEEGTASNDAWIKARSTTSEKYDDMSRQNMFSRQDIFTEW